MDDYILKVLSRQLFREETAPEVLLEKQRYISREEPEERDAREHPARFTEDGAEPWGKGEAALWSMLKGMEPLSVGAFRETERGRQDGAHSWHVPESLSRLSGTVFAQKTRQLSPEGLSMFYQRDARRFS